MSDDNMQKCGKVVKTSLPKLEHESEISGSSKPTPEQRGHEAEKKRQEKGK